MVVLVFDGSPKMKHISLVNPEDKLMGLALGLSALHTPLVLKVEFFCFASKIFYVVQIYRLHQLSFNIKKTSCECAPCLSLIEAKNDHAPV